MAAWLLQVFGSREEPGKQEGEKAWKLKKLVISIEVRTLYRDPTFT